MSEEFNPDTVLEDANAEDLNLEIEEAGISAGDTLPEGTPVATEDAVIEAIREVEDPEIMINVYDMGLIYKIDIAKNGDVAIDMTLTAPGCPVAGSLPLEVAEAAAALDGIGKATVTLVWEPQWTPERLTEEARMMLDMF